jgi:hypothetical protein
VSISTTATALSPLIALGPLSFSDDTPRRPLVEVTAITSLTWRQFPEIVRIIHEYRSLHSVI